MAATTRDALIGYLKAKVEMEDWHAVSDVANDLREIDAVAKVKATVKERLFCHEFTGLRIEGTKKCWGPAGHGPPCNYQESDFDKMLAERMRDERMRATSSDPLPD